MADDALDQVFMVVEPTADGPDALWFVASGRSARGAYWPVRRTHEGCFTVFRCPCPWGRGQERRQVTVRAACRHMKLVVAFENERLARPIAPPNVSALVD